MSLKLRYSLTLILAVSPCLTWASASSLDAGARLTTLRDEIRRHDELYFKMLRPAVSDAQYDRLFDELVLLEQRFPALAAADSPTGQLGSDLDSPATKLRHDRPMLSLSSTSGPEAVESFLHRVSLSAGSAEAAADTCLPRMLVQPKVDGLPVEIIYLSGRLVSAATRGDGRYGEDVTARVLKITGIPLTLSGSYPARVAVRGEIYADLALMARATGTDSEPYATPRHFAAGILRSQHPDPLALAALRLFPFELANAEDIPGVGSDLAALSRLAEWGFPVRLDLTWQVTTLEQIRARYEEYRSTRERHPFAADGIVVKLDDLALRQQLGEGARTPFWAAAWKFPPATAATLVRAIRWQVGRTGRRTPVAEVDQVTLGGVRVSHVSLNNAGSLAQSGIAVGDRVVIALVADVIPQVQEVIKQGAGAGSTPDQPPRSTPPATPAPPALDACLSDAPGCRAQYLARAAHFVSKAGLNIPGLGRGRLRKLVEAGLVPDLAALFRLKAQDVAAVPGFGVRSALRLTAALRRASHPETVRLITAIGIPGVGPVAARRLLEQFGSLEELLVINEGNQDDGAAAGCLRSFFATRGGADLLARFRELGLL